MATPDRISHPSKSGPEEAAEALRRFVREHVVPYDPATDTYHVPAFRQSVQATKATALYHMHSYWSKKPHDAIRQYIRHYTQPGDVVLDPFCGSGGTSLAALLEGRKTIGSDRSPIAVFIARHYCTPVDPKALHAAFLLLQKQIQPEMDWLYATRCERCHGRASTAYTVYSRIVTCPRCRGGFPFFEALPSSDITSPLCPQCQRGKKANLIALSDCDRGMVPVLTQYICANGCKPARAERQWHDVDPKKRAYFRKYDLQKIREIERQPIPYSVPEQRMMNAPEGVRRWGLLWRPYLGERERVIDFFRPRNAWALGLILSHIEKLPVASTLRAALRFAFSSSLLNASDLYRYRRSGKGGLSMGTYYVGPLFQVMHAGRAFAKKVNDLIRGYRDLKVAPEDGHVACLNAWGLKGIADNSIDYIFTDPPYAWKVQYGESNFLWEAWLSLDTHWHGDEIIINAVRGQSEAEWAERLQRALAECHRVLKPGRWLTLCYHDGPEGTWPIIQRIMSTIGFHIDCSGSTQSIDTQQKAWKQLVTGKLNRRDLILNFRKSRPSEVLSLIGHDFSPVQPPFADLAREIVRDYLTAHPQASRDHIYDALVSHLIQLGRMERYDFDEILREVLHESVCPRRNAGRQDILPAGKLRISTRSASEEHGENSR